MIHLLEKFQSSKVAVVGDLMLDIYIQGAVDRISPEAPVPVVRFASERRVPGGAANVAANVATLGAAVRLVGIAGRDESFSLLSQMLQVYAAIDLSGVVLSDERSTTTKTRIIGHHQQIVRIDREENFSVSETLERALIASASDAIADADLVIFSDYGKGVLQDNVLNRLFSMTRKMGKLSIVDPKRRDLSVYRGASIITPNRAELSLATGKPCETDQEVIAAAQMAHAICDADILLTRSEKGMSFIPREGKPIHLATVAKEVFDVSGAGDTVVATLGVALASQFSLIDAMKLANHAASIAVGKAGTATVSSDELRSAYLVEELFPDIDDGRLLTLEEMVILRDFWKRESLTVGITNGCFDLIHPGHVSLIRQAAAACDRLIVALNTDRSIQRLKGENRPVQTASSRAEVIGALKNVAAVILFDEETPYELIKALQPDVLVKGADYTEATVVGADIVRAAGGQVILAKLTEGQSTTALLAKSLPYQGAVP